MRRVIFYSLFSLWTAFVCISGLPLLLGFRTKALDVLGFVWGKGGMYLLRMICGISCRVTGAEHLPPHSGYIVASLHQSTFETIAFWVIFYPPTFILKRELLRIPLFGWYLRRMGMIAIDRSKPTSAIRTVLSGALDVIKAKPSARFVIFPEGSRDASASEYQVGVFAVQKATGLNVIPVRLNSWEFWPKAGLTNRRGVIEVEICKAIEPCADRGEFMQRLQRALR